MVPLVDHAILGRILTHGRDPQAVGDLEAPKGDGAKKCAGHGSSLYFSAVAATLAR